MAYCAPLGAVRTRLRRLFTGLVFARLHSRTITPHRWALLIAVGVALMTGWWSEVTVWLRASIDRAGGHLSLHVERPVPSGALADARQAGIRR